MAGVKGKGFAWWVDFTNDDVYEAGGCVFVATPPGKSRPIIDFEPCLGDDVIEKDTGDLEFTELQMTVVYDLTDTDVGPGLETALDNDNEIQIALEYPFDPKRYQYFKIKLTDLQNEQIQRDQKMRRTFSALPTTNPWGTINTTAPSTGA